MENFDDVDRRILRALQEDCSGSVAELAARAGVSQTPCWRRVKRLEEAGYIKRRVAILDAEALDLAMTAYVLVKTAKHDEDWLIQFSEGVTKIPEVVEMHRMTGDIDYLLKVIVRDMADYDRIYKKVIKVADLVDVSASFSMECIKSTTSLPIRG